MRRGWLAIAAVSIVCAAASAQQAPPRDTRAAGPAGTAEITGTIVADEPGTPPIPNAQVSILGLDAGVIRVASADDQGRFRLAGLAAGRYLVSGAKPPYVGMVYGAREAGRAGTAIALGEGERRDGVVLKLKRGGVISGMVTDEYGGPAAGVGLALMPPAGGNLQAQFMTMAFLPPQTTDDRGMYRFSGLPAGEYLVVATRTDRADPDARVVSQEEIDAALIALREPPPAVVSQPALPGPVDTTVTPGVGRSGRPQTSAVLPMMSFMAMGNGDAFAPVYYPGTVEAAEAQPVKVGASEERLGIDFVARAVPTSRIEGLVIGPDGQPHPGAFLALRPLAQSGQPEVMSFAMMALSTSARVAADGRFTMNGVPPGRYLLEARSFSAPMSPMAIAATAAAGGAASFSPPKPQYYASAELSVASGQPTTGVELRLQKGVSIAGKVMFQPTRLDPPKDANRVMVVLAPVTTDLLGLAGGASFAATAADGTFLVEGVMPGRYLLTATATDVGHALQWMPQSVMVGGREMVDLPIEIKPSAEIRDVAVTLSDAQQEVVGTLQDAAGRPAPEYTILLFAADRAYWIPSSRRVLMTRPATSGAFSFRGPLCPPPGDYLLAALTDMDPADQYNPAFLAHVAKAAIRITVNAGQQTRQDIRIAGGRD